MDASRLPSGIGKPSLCTARFELAGVSRGVVGVTALSRKVGGGGDGLKLAMRGCDIGETGDSPEWVLRHTW